MKIHPIRLSAALLVLLPLAACGGGAEPSAAEVPSQDELDAEATEDITDENADEAFEDLKNEIEGDE